MTTILNDLKYGCRMLARKPGFTGVAVSMLALGIGANIAIFSFVNAYLLRPFPYDDAERLVDFTETHATFGRMSIAYANFLDWQKKNQTFEELACYRDGHYNLTGTDVPERIRYMQASANLLPMLGVRPTAGRLYEPADDRAEANATVVINQGFWQRRFDSNPDAIGASLTLDGDAYTIVGVLPDTFSFPPIVGNPIDVWTPIGLNARNSGFMRRYNHSGISGIGKLKPGITVAQARADLNRVAGQLATAYPDTNAGCSMVCNDFHESVVGDIQPMLLLLMCAVALVLIMVCVNIANLLFVRSTERIHELSIRCALGAGRFRIIRQLLCENLNLVIAGSVLGIVLGRGGYRLLCAQLPDVIRHNTEMLFGVDAGFVLFILVITLGSGLVFGLLPAWHISRVRFSAAIRDNARTATAGQGHSRMRDMLVVSEITLALILLVGTGLMLRSFIHYVQADPGFNPDSTLTARITLPDSRYASDEKTRMFHRQLLDQVQAMPGVVCAGVTSNLMGGWQSTYYVEGSPVPEPGQHRYSEYNIVSPDFFGAMGIRLLEGRTFSERDHENSQPVVVVDERFARQWWPDESPLGKRLLIHHSGPDPNASWSEVIGVVRHVKHYGVDQNSRESLYLSTTQHSFNNVTLVARTQGDPLQLVEPVRKAVLQIDPDLPISGVQTLQAIRDGQSFMRRLMTSIMGLFALTALLLSALGLYGIIAYSVSRRTHEIGIRMAMGACFSDILRLVLTHGGKLIMIGIGVGLVGALAVTHLMSSLLFGVTVRDPLTFVSVILLLIGTTLLACTIPARRAARIDPMEALRYE